MSRLVRVGSLDFNRLLLTACNSPGVPNYPVLLHSIPPHSHSMILDRGYALIYRRKFFGTRRRTVSPIRQKFALLNSKDNFADSEFLALQRLSRSIGRFPLTPARPGR